MGRDWGGLRTIIDSRRPTEDRVDCPTCGYRLESNGSRYICPFDRTHWDSPNLPRD